MAFGRDGQRIWSIKLDAAAVGDPLIHDRAVWFITERGKLEVRELTDGRPREALDLGGLPGGGLIMAGGRLVVPVGQGTMRALTANPVMEKKQ